MTDTSKGLTVDEMKLLSDFSNVVTSREFTKGVKIEKLILSYTETDGFTIDLVERKNATSPPVTEPPAES